MREFLLVALVATSACSTTPEPMPPKAPNNELIIGEFHRRPPIGNTAARFRADGSVTLASEAKDLDSKPIAAGRWHLQGDQLTLSYDSGDMCPAGVEGTYKVVISKIGIRFTKVDDGCERRAKIDGETWYRIK